LTKTAAPLNQYTYDLIVSIIKENDILDLDEIGNITDIIEEDHQIDDAMTIDAVYTIVMNVIKSLNDR